MKNDLFENFIFYLSEKIKSVEEENRFPFEKEAEIYYYQQILCVAEQFYNLSKKNQNEDMTIDKLKKENDELKRKLEKSTFDRIKTPHEIISEIIAEKVNNSIKSSFSKNARYTLKRKIMEALKWKLQVRYVNELKNEHIEQAKEFIQNYKIDDFYLV